MGSVRRRRNPHSPAPRRSAVLGHSDYDSVSTEDLLDAFGHQEELLESIIAVTRGGEVSIW